MVSAARSSISEGCRSRDSLSTLITGPSASATSAVLELLSQMRSTDGDSVVWFPKNRGLPEVLRVYSDFVAVVG